MAHDNAGHGTPDHVHEHPAHDDTHDECDDRVSKNMIPAFPGGSRVEHSTSDKSGADEKQNQGSHGSTRIVSRSREFR